MKIKHKMSYFLFITFGAGWACMLLGMFPGDSAVEATLLNYYPFVPLVGVLLAFNFKLGYKDTGISWTIPKNSNMKNIVAAWYMPIVLTVLGAVLYFLLNWGQFDPSLGVLQNIVTEQNSPMSKELLLGSLIFSAAISSPFIMALSALGQEVGFRGYMQPELEKKYGLLKSLLITGIVNGIWFIPLVWLGKLMFGTGYFGEPFTGIITMVIYMICMNVMCTYLYKQTGSILVSALCHGVFNAFGAIPAYFLKEIPAYSIVGPGLPGLISMVPMMIMALLMYNQMMKATQIQGKGKSN